MKRTEDRIDRAALFAALCAGAMIAQQVGAKATRDAIFLSNFAVTSLPYMLMAAALLSIGAVAAASRMLSRFGPAGVVPPAFAVSALLSLGEWLLIGSFPRAVAVAVYLHIAVFGSILISSFWSLVNERFDPRTAKQQMGRIAGAGTLGGLAGGLMAERVAAYFDTATMLPLLAALHLACALVVRGVLPPAASPEPGEGSRLSSEDADEADSGGGLRLGLKVLKRVPYLRDLSILVFLSTMAAAFLDYAFKARAASAFSGESLLRFFAAFYTVVGLVTFLVQAGLGRRSLEKLGLARTVALLPFGVAIGGIGALFAPVLAVLAGLRGSEAALHSSLFRSGYELLYTPIAPKEKRATKTIVDVGLDRLGDAVGGGVIKLVLVAAPAFAISSLIAAAVGISALGLMVTRRLQRGYVKALEKSLMLQAGEKSLPNPISANQTIFPGSISSDQLELAMTQQSMMDLPVMSTFEGATPLDYDTGVERGRVGEERPPPEVLASSAPLGPFVSVESPPRAQDRRVEATQLDPLTAIVAELRCGDARRIQRALRSKPSLDPSLVGHVIVLLAWDEVYAEAIRALRGVASELPGQMLDALLNSKQEFAIRRRIPRVLSAVNDQRVVEGLMQGLDDARFEVRFQCGRALALIHDRDGAGELRFSRRQVFGAVSREVAVDKRVWESQRLLDKIEERGGESDEGALFDEFVRYRSTRSMEHVFTLLSLALPQEPLRVAYRGLHTNDRALRGTALEYLESVVPAFIRQSLWPFLEDHRPADHQQKPRDQVLEELLRSQLSIELNLKDLRKKLGEDESGSG